MAIPVFPTLSKNYYTWDAFEPLTTEKFYNPTIRAEFESGQMFTRSRFTRRPGGWKFTMKNVEQPDVDLIRAFIDSSVYGEALPFTWTEPITSATKTVQIEGEVTFVYTSFGTTHRYDVAMTLREV